MGKPFRIGLLAILAVVSSLSTTAFAATTTGGSHTARPLIAGKIDDTKLVTLEGNTHPAAKIAANDRGAVADDFAMNGMLLQLKRSPEQEKALGILMDQLHTPGNPNYHQWLTEAQFDELFGVNEKDVEQVSAWLTSHGFKVTGVVPDGMVMQFSGTAGSVREAFHTEIHNLQLKNGEKHISNMSDPQIPAALKDVVVGPTSLNNFMPHPNNIKRNKVSINSTGTHKGHLGPKGDYTFDDGGEYYAFVPGDEATIYNLNPLFSSGITGKGATIGLIEDEDAYNTTNGVSPDWQTFVSVFGLSQYGGTQTTVHPSGSLACADPGDGNDGTDFEVALDIEYASASAPGANVVVESCPDSSVFGGLIAVENLVSATTIAAPVLSISYGYCEVENGAAANQSYSYAYQHGAARGVSIFVSSGDESDVSCDADKSYARHGAGVSGFTSTPYNVSVGGTDFGDTYAGTNSTYWSSTNSATYESALSYVPEIPWNDSCASELIANYETGSTVTYGAGGFCNSANGFDFITTASGSGGPSSCYSGSSTVTGVANGTCKGQPKPSWQSVYGNPADGVRDIPDVSLFASNGVWSHYLVLCFSNPSEQGSAPCTGAPENWAGAGGTSASSPMMAGIQTLINQYAGELSGNPNYVYYKLAAKEYGSSGDSTCNSTNGASGTTNCIFYDITQGDMNVPCSYDVGTTAYNCYDVIKDTEGYNIGVGSLTNSSYSKIYGTNVGWDFSTGIGSVNAYNLAKAWKSTSAGGYPLTATVSVSGSSSTYTSGSGATITYTVTVSGAGSYPTGTVSLYNTTVSPTTVVGTGALTASSGCASGGTCTETATIAYKPGTLASGTDTITATYTTTNENYGTASGTTTLTVSGNSTATTTTAISITPNPVGYGQTAALEANVTASSGTASGGSVTFKASGVTLGSCTLNNGTCTFSASTLGQPLGTYSVTGTYAGTTGFSGSTSPVVNATLEKAVTSTKLVITPTSPITEPATATLTATVARPSGYSGSPSGTVKFYDGSTYLGSATLSGGVAVYTHSTSGLPHGSYTITADYEGDGGDNTSSGTATTTLN
jgi:subtilase family serine protease